jgi:hypothetical protein
MGSMRELTEKTHVKNIVPSVWEVSHKCYFFKNVKKKKQCHLAPVAHSWKPSLSEGREQKDRGSKAMLANSSRDPILKKPTIKKGLVEWFKQ